MSLAAALKPEAKPKPCQPQQQQQQQQMAQTKKTGGVIKAVYQDKLKSYQRQLDKSLKEAQEAEEKLKYTLVLADKVNFQFKMPLETIL